MNWLTGICGLLLSVLVLPLPALAQAVPGGDPPVIWTGIYSADQAGRGKAIVTAHCTACHGSNQPLIGDIFMLHWQGRDVARLFQKIRTMPPRNSSGLPSTKDKLDAMAYILQQNGFPPGTSELPDDESALAGIRLLPRDGLPQMRTGSVVQVFGCLSRGAGNAWQVTNSSTPEAAELDSRFAGAAPAETPAGTGTIELLSAYPSPAEHVGKKVQVKGLLIHNAGGDQINVISLVPVAASCAP